ncbi:hypothetical protein HYC85_029259 [Camellia sinensis]|uniref:Uncharacterized protein n=1 Tax=Camellia sinensis TaxID=4442 RepID=A0A7J7FZW9_CAMSI|nr:hypothetical protein HYC85_029259 [Camellia sinensis]
MIRDYDRLVEAAAHVEVTVEVEEARQRLKRAGHSDARETCTKLREAETPLWEAVGGPPTSYWAWRPPIDQFMWEKPKGVVCLPEKLVGRLVPASSFWFFCNKGKRKRKQGICDPCVHDHSPRHCTSSRECGPRSSCHKSRISMHDGRAIELHDSI